MSRRGAIFILSSPSGAGKSTLLRLLRQRVDNLSDSVSYTTRRPRPGETNGVDYHFLDDAEFDRRAAAGFFAEWAWVHANRYGTGRVDLETILDAGHDVITDIDVQGAGQLSLAFPEAVTVFILPPSLEEMLRRLRNRGTESDMDLERRLDTARREMEALPAYRYLVVNRDLEAAAAEIEKIIAAERRRLDRRDAEGIASAFMAGHEIGEED